MSDGAVAARERWVPVSATLPLVATALVVAASGSTWLVALLVVVLAGVSALSAWLAPETNPDVARPARPATAPASA